jgi:hypothetical protein
MLSAEDGVRGSALGGAAVVLGGLVDAGAMVGVAWARSAGARPSGQSIATISATTIPATATTRNGVRPGRRADAGPGSAPVGASELPGPAVAARPARTRARSPCIVCVL